MDFSDYNNYSDCTRVILDNLPHSIGAFVVCDGCDDFYTIVLNSRFSYEMQRQAYEHEMAHIINGDFNRDPYGEEIDVSQIEKERHNK